jgi:hypothetical protein
MQVLHWTRPGAVWAIDFAEPPLPIEGSYSRLLAVRDLASGYQPSLSGNSGGLNGENLSKATRWSNGNCGAPRASSATTSLLLLFCSARKTRALFDHSDGPWFVALTVWLPLPLVYRECPAGTVPAHA